ncbi:hypothetical protein Ahy_A06g027084 isoform C [Arachis hypogaea]|uniref:Di19 zinc-binding domain-containing protein n=1 Tax=Arachis hypogaea TaxID=3818 RepID=A0A445CMM1_ARAHY|nr:hypothetical protein Ahy_A06g027084 isoform C [Arachis hypogaea]
MDRDTLGFPFGTASRSYPSRHKSRYAEVFEDFEEMKGEDELRTVYPCPFCVDDFDLLELCCHIDLEHSLEPKSGICPVCAVWVGTNMVDHITAQHGSIIKISFLIHLIKKNIIFTKFVSIMVSFYQILLQCFFLMFFVLHFVQLFCFLDSRLRSA